jgi:hypothetical protein
MMDFDVNGTRVTVESIGAEYSPDDSAYRQAYNYSIVTDVWRYDGNDIRSGCGAAVDESEAARTLFAFLSAAAEAVDYEMRGGTSENSDLFPPHVTQWAYLNSDEIEMLSLEPETTTWTVFDADGREVNVHGAADQQTALDLAWNLHDFNGTHAKALHGTSSENWTA